MKKHVNSVPFLAPLSAMGAPADASAENDRVAVSDHKFVLPDG
jgi:hypothetical protein